VAVRVQVPGRPGQLDDGMARDQLSGVVVVGSPAPSQQPQLQLEVQPVTQPPVVVVVVRVQVPVAVAKLNNYSGDSQKRFECLG